LEQRQKTQVLPKVIWEEHIATPHGRECLSAVCASCTMFTAGKSSYSATSMLHPYHFSPSHIGP